MLCLWQVEVWDFDVFTANDLIGTTTIDLEDRCGFRVRSWSEADATADRLPVFCLRHPAVVCKFCVLRSLACGVAADGLMRSGMRTARRCRRPRGFALCPLRRGPCGRPSRVRLRCSVCFPLALLLCSMASARCLYADLCAVVFRGRVLCSLE